MKRLLIANRGEIARRVIHTARRMGIVSIAVYSEVDQLALFVSEADEAYPLQGMTPKETYLDYHKILQLCLKHRIDAVHPGYGFLSENEAFASLCEKNGIIFVGPPASVIKAMGDKASAKALMDEAGVPLVPGYHGDRQEHDFLSTEASRIGYPVLIKAVAGGGGKGMRAVYRPEEFNLALDASKREAQNAFGNDVMLIEKLIEQPRHIEVQLFFDRQGHGVYLFDRDCSIQRRHQKVIEEAPAPGLTDETRLRMGEAALSCGQKINYEGAGTVEFLVDKHENFYFMEMNTRLQVEHPVTELITGVDLVEWQLRIARGEPLPLAQDQLLVTGHAVEARLYAEDPHHDFLPSIGHLKLVCFPVSGTVNFSGARNSNREAFLRIDSGVQSGDEISVHYDPMIAKTISWAPTRHQAIQHLAESLKHCFIAGVETNTEYLISLLEHPRFGTGEFSTNFISDQAENLQLEACLNNSDRAAVAAIIWQQKSLQVQQSAYDPHPDSPWNQADLWSLNLHRSCLLEYWWQNKTQEADLRQPEWLVPLYSGRFSLLSNEQPCEVQFTFCAGRHLRLTVNGVHSQHQFVVSESMLTVFNQGRKLTFELPGDSTLVKHHGEHSETALTAPMGGTIVKINCEEGQKVKRGETLLVMEAMKMEHTLKAADEGTITKLLCREKDTVSTKQLLIEFEPYTSPSGQNQGQDVGELS